MKRLMVCIFIFAGLLTSAVAQPVRVVLLDFEDQTGMKADAQLGGGVDSAKLAEKGGYLLARELLKQDDFVLIERRDFMEQMKRLQSAKSDKDAGVVPSRLEAARALRADVLLRGSIVSFSTSKEAINQGGYKAEFSRVLLRVVLQAQDAVNGAVIAVSDGAASQQFRQTSAKQTILGEDDILELFAKALTSATPEVEKGISKRIKAMKSREKLKLSVTTTQDPAMVEIDGVLVGTTPMEALEIYKGDHLLSVSRPGSVTVTKQIRLDKDARIQVPLLREDLTAEEKMVVYEKAEMKIYMTDGKPDLLIQTMD